MGLYNGKKGKLRMRIKCVVSQLSECGECVEDMPMSNSGRPH